MTIDIRAFITECASNQDSIDAVNERFGMEDPVLDNEETREQFCDGEEWVEEETDEPLGEYWSDYMTVSFFVKRGAPYAHKPGFEPDMSGACDEALIERFANNPTEAEKCLLHIYTAPGDLGEEVRIEIVTTPDKSAVICWQLIGD